MSCIGGYVNEEDIDSEAMSLTLHKCIGEGLNQLRVLVEKVSLLSTKC